MIRFWNEICIALIFGLSAPIVFILLNDSRIKTEIRGLKAKNFIEIFGDVVQLVRTSDCRSEGRGFDPRRPRHINKHK